MLPLVLMLLSAGDPPVIVVEPVPLVYAGDAQGEVVMAYDQAWANKGAKPLEPFVARVADRFDFVLPDYPSARFRSVTLGYRELKEVMCGYYNARNRMGAYVGWAPFYAIGDGKTAILKAYAPGDEVPYSYKFHCEGPTAWIAGDYSRALTFSQ